jgi:hypothetical protein
VAFLLKLLLIRARTDCCNFTEIEIMEDVILNKVAQSGLITLDLADFYPEGEIAIFDVKDYLFMELILKEKEYRETLKNFDWSSFKNKIVAITCSADAIIPLWAYMLAVSYLEPYAKDIVFGNADEVLKIVFLKKLQRIDAKEFTDKRVVIKGCGDKVIPEAAFVEITKILRPEVKSIMYGEPCSTVPIYKKK